MGDAPAGAEPDGGAASGLLGDAGFAVEPTGAVVFVTDETVDVGCPVRSTVPVAVLTVPCAVLDVELAVD